MPVLDMARAPSVAILHKMNRYKPNLSKALRTLEKILAPVVVSFTHTVVTEVLRFRSTPCPLLL